MDSVANIGSLVVSPTEVVLGDLAKGYSDRNEDGVSAMSGVLNVRPAYQREFVYDDKKRSGIVLSVYKGLPINVFYFGESDDGEYRWEVIDGQQRIISMCEFMNNKFPVKFDEERGSQFYQALSQDEQNLFKKYKLIAYICKGSFEDRLKWFRTINISGEKLNEQELRNSVATGMWLTSAKMYFSRTNCVAYKVGRRYVSGVPNRQELFEEALRWVADRDGITIEDYMQFHRKDTDASDLISYYEDVISWVDSFFNGIGDAKSLGRTHWGELYNKYHESVPSLDAGFVKEEVDRLQEDDEVTRQYGIYPYIISKDEKYLNIREFPERIAHQVYSEQDGICKCCKEKFEFSAMEADHVIPWSKGGKTVKANCQMLCRKCNREKRAGI